MGSSKCLTRDSARPEKLTIGVRVYSNRFCPFAKRVKMVLGMALTVNCTLFLFYFVFSNLWSRPRNSEY